MGSIKNLHYKQHQVHFQVSEGTRFFCQASDRQCPAYCMRQEHSDRSLDGQPGQMAVGDDLQHLSETSSEAEKAEY